MRQLDLANNKLDKLDDKVFTPDTLPAIEELTLSNNNISELPKSLWMLASLTNLQVRANKLRTIPSQIESLTNLSTLDLGYNEIDSVASELSNCSSLQHLNLFGNKIKSIPDLSQLSYLQFLYLSYNQLPSIQLQGLMALEDLFVSFNPLKSVPADLSDNCPNLKNFHAVAIGATEIPKELGKL